MTGPSRVKSAVNSFEILMQSGKASLKTKESDSGSKRKRQVEKVEKVRKKSKVQSNTLLNWGRVVESRDENDRAEKSVHSVSDVQQRSGNSGELRQVKAKLSQADRHSTKSK